MTLGVDVDGLIATIRVTLEAVESLGPERMEEFDRELIPEIRRHEANVGA